MLQQQEKERKKLQLRETIKYSETANENKLSSQNTKHNNDDEKREKSSLFASVCVS